VQGFVLAKVKHAIVSPWFPFWSGEVHVYFHFGRDGKLIKYVVRGWWNYL
jgi:hypothetical protein